MKKTLWMALFLGPLILSCGSQKTKLHLSGTLEVTEHAVGVRVPGRIVSENIQEGAEVKKGQLLATLEREVQAKKDYDRVSSLFEKGGTTRQAVEQAELTLEDQRVSAPVDGTVLIKVHEVGEVVVAGGAVAVIGETATPWVRVFVPEGLVSRLSLHHAATLKFDGLDRVIRGEVVSIAPKAEFTPRNVQSVEERVLQTFAVKVAILPEDKPATLRPGVSADVTLELP